MTYRDANGRMRLKQAVDIKATVGIATCPFRAFVFVSNCPLSDPSCLDHDLSSTMACPHFCEVETIDYLPTVKCDHPQAKSNLER